MKGVLCVVNFWKEGVFWVKAVGACFTESNRLRDCAIACDRGIAFFCCCEVKKVLGESLLKAIACAIARFAFFCCVKKIREKKESNRLRDGGFVESNRLRDCAMGGSRFFCCCVKMLV